MPEQVKRPNPWRRRRKKKKKKKKMMMMMMISCICNVAYAK
jgi:Tfp pilus assembly protein PilN